MKKFPLFLVIVAPWVILFKNDDPVGGMIAMFLQSTIIGWIPASMWAWRTLYPQPSKKQNQKKESNMKVQK